MKTEYHTIDEYIAMQVPEVQETLETIRAIIKNAVPEAIEVISYQMPAFKYHGMLAYFAAFTKHYSLFVSPSVLQLFKPNLKTFKTTKSGINFPIGTPVQEKLIVEIVKMVALINSKKNSLKASKKKQKK